MSTQDVSESRITTQCRRILAAAEFLHAYRASHPEEHRSQLSRVNDLEVDRMFVKLASKGRL